ncbi:MAG TPA: alpha-amylase family glycosyl hydrolase [Devosia sp.]|nr:alpha-amylase family glycosyl hydrolase [Devosia sp.]
MSGGKTTFRLWAPVVDTAELIIKDRPPLRMERAADGFFEVAAEGCAEGTRYRFRAKCIEFPDLASRQQDGDSAGWSIVRAPLTPSTRREPIRPWTEMVICEVHIGTVSPEGTFNGLRDRLEHFRDAGFTCLEIMPINEFPGARNWGYDGTLIFAPESSYGTPEDLRALVDRAHELRLCLILDVVYNHFGETDNFVEQYAPEWFDQEIKTPWGPGVDFARPMVRQFYYENTRMWLTEYDFDGLRFDAIHEIKSDARDQFLGELALAAKQAKPYAMLIVENVKNSARWLERNDRNEPMVYTAQWNDDMHHVMDFLVTGDGTKTGYDDTSKDPFADLEKALVDGFIHDPGEGDNSDGRSRGGPASNLPPDSFVTFVQNHDQIGNRADCKRLPDRTSAEKLDFVAFVKFLAPQIPLCFMGDEGWLRSGFPFFVDLPEAAAKAKRDDRYKQMAEIFNEPVPDGALPEPNDPATFASAKIPWEEYAQNEERRRALDRFRTLASWRRERVWPLSATPCLDAHSVRNGNCFIVNWVFEAGVLTMALNPTDHTHDIPCEITRAPVSSGDYSQLGDLLRLGSWSAVAW